MFSERYEIVCEQVSEFSHIRPGPLDSLRPVVASDCAPLLWSEGFGLGGEPERARYLPERYGTCDLDEVRYSLKRFSFSHDYQPTARRRQKRTA